MEMLIRFLNKLASGCRGMQYAVKVALGHFVLTPRTSFEIRVVFSKFKSEARDRTLARTGPTAGFKLRTRIRHSTQNKLIFKGETNYERNRHGY